jgi:hypothetical protein
MANEPKFVNGLIVKRHPKAPEWVICALSFKAEEFAKYLAENQKNGWLNVDVKLSRGGKYYAEENQYVPGTKNATRTVGDTQNEGNTDYGTQEASTGQNTPETGAPQDPSQEYIDSIPF